MEQINCRHFNQYDMNHIDEIFKKSILSAVPFLLSCNNILFNWYYRSIVIIFGFNILYPIIDYLYLILLYFSLVFLLYIGIIIYVKYYYIYKVVPTNHYDLYLKKRNTIIVATYQNKIVGFTSLRSTKHYNIGWMTYLFVDPKYHNKGIAKKLVSKLKFFGENNNYKYIKGGTSSLQYSAIYFYNKYAQNIYYSNYYNIPVYKIYFRFDI